MFKNVLNIYNYKYKTLYTKINFWFYNYFFHDGNLLNVEINEKEVKEFLKKYEPSFDMLADEYIKKIQH